MGRQALARRSSLATVRRWVDDAATQLDDLRAPVRGIQRALAALDGGRS